MRCLSGRRTSLGDNIAASTEKAKSLGAMVLADITEIPEMGRYSILHDPTGAGPLHSGNRKCPLIRRCIQDCSNAKERGNDSPQSPGSARRTRASACGRAPAPRGAWRSSEGRRRSATVSRRSSWSIALTQTYCPEGWCNRSCYAGHQPGGLILPTPRLEPFPTSHASTCCGASSPPGGGAWPPG